MITLYEKIGLMGLVVESTIKKHEKIALLETIKESNDIELVASVLVEFGVLDEQKAKFLSKVGGGLKAFGRKVKGKMSDYEKARQAAYKSQIRTHLKYSGASLPGEENIKGLASALS